MASRLGARKTSLLLLALLAFGPARRDGPWRPPPGAETICFRPGKSDYEQVKLARTPNIYFLCLESYHGFDAWELYGFDNADFRAFLERTGSFPPAAGAGTARSADETSPLVIFPDGTSLRGGAFGNHDSLYARGFISGSGTYYNPVLRILKRSGYDIVYLLPSDYYYRPGGPGGLPAADPVLAVCPAEGYRSARFIGREPDTLGLGAGTSALRKLGWLAGWTARPSFSPSWGGAFGPRLRLPDRPGSVCRAVRGKP